MTQDLAAAPLETTAANPKIGFVSLGCPKALTDSELILTQLRAEGYDIPEPDHTAEGDVRTTRAVYEALRAFRGAA